MVSLISRRIVAGQTEELESLLPDLVEFTLAPYVGNDEAATHRPRLTVRGPRPGVTTGLDFVAEERELPWREQRARDRCQ